MRPDVRFDKPGRSPYMDMELVPMYADEGDGAAVTIDPRMVQNLGIRTAPVRRGEIAGALRAVGVVAADERRIEVVESRSSGWVERLHVRAVGEPVKAGQLLAEIYAPDLATSQEELLLALEAGDATLVRAARERLRRLGVSQRQLDELARTRKVVRTVPIHAPRGGIVSELGIREGSQVAPGMTLFRLADLSSVWITAEIPESDAARVAVGNKAEARLSALPGQLFTGTIEYVYPTLNAASRTLPARVRFDNPAMQLKPGMYAELTVQGESRQQVLLVPAEALIRTGTRSVVIIAEGEGRFRPTEVTAGPEHDGVIEIAAGLIEGQDVVVSGQFLIDSESTLRAAFGRIVPADATTGESR
jgi:Cu(I)/Ag(I) efflux system membrane fusion protein